MEESRFRPEDKDRDIVFSHAVKAGKRIYYLDVRKTRKDDYYLSITESKKIAGSEMSDGKASFEKHKIFLYREDFSNFIDGLTRTMRFIHEADAQNLSDIAAAEEPQTIRDSPNYDNSSANTDGDVDFNIEF